MTFNEYQEKARTTAIYPGSSESLSKKAATEIYEYFSHLAQDIVRKDEIIETVTKKLKLLDLIPLLYTCLGLAGETGELLEKIKKVIRDKGGILDTDTVETLKGEISDTYWYSANLATELGLKASDIAQFNLDKLASRKERGVLKGDGDNR